MAVDPPLVAGGALRSRLAHGIRRPMATAESHLGVLGYFGTVYRRTWRGSIIGRFLSPLLFLLSMGLGLGSLVDARAGGVAGESYLHFVVPGIVATQAMWIAMNESTYQVFAYIKWNKMYAAMLATPLRVSEVLRGHLLAVVGHLTLGTTIFVAIAALFGGFRSWWALLCVPIGVLTGMAFTVPIFAYTGKQNGDDGFNILFRLVITPLMLFSGTFFPVGQLPVWMRPVAWVTPLWHGVELARGASTGGLAPGWAVLHAAALAAFVVVGWLLAVRIFTHRLTP
jgi:lipooligosaccharide transport system permease protein